MRIFSRFICFAVAVTFLFSINIQADPSSDEAEIRKSIEDLKKQKEDIGSQQDAAQTQLNETKQEKNKTEQEMQAIDDDLNKTTDDLLRVIDRLDETSANLSEKEQELQHAQEMRDDQYDLLKQRLNFMYKNGTIGYLDIIFEAKSFPDFINRVEYINRIAKNDKSLLNKLTDTTDLITETVNEIDQQKSTFEQLAVEQQQKQGELQNTLARKQDMFNRLDSDEKSYEEKLAMLSETEDKIVTLIKQKEKEAAEAAERAAAEKAAAEAAAAKRAAAGGGSAAGGGFATSATVNSSPYNGRMHWPVPGRYMLSDVYRARYNPVNGRREFHKGIDIPAPTGTSIVAAESGTVITAGWINGYGYAVIIDHGNGITTLYGHNSRLVVSAGQRVAKGEVIARAGSTGNSTGPHCHFEIRINGSAVNPAPYVM